MKYLINIRGHEESVVIILNPQYIRSIFLMLLSGVYFADPFHYKVLISQQNLQKSIPRKITL